jgi:chromosomal replication initiation ATPase DnaA
MTPYSYPGIDMSENSKQASRVETIKRLVAKNYHKSFDEIDNDCRKRELSQVRQALMYWLSTYTTVSLTDIGSVFKRNYNHATIIHGKKTYGDIYIQHPVLRQGHKLMLADIKNILE